MSVQKTTEAVTKTYVLLSSLDANAPIYQTTPGGQRAQIKKIPRFRPYLQVTFEDETGVSKTIRYKANCNSIWAEEQIEKYKIPANEKFTDAEREAPYFRNGQLTTNKKTLQNYLEAYPGFLGFKGTCDHVKAPEFKLLDKVADAKKLNETTRLHVKAAARIFELELEEAQAMLIRLNGSAFVTPTTLEECQNLLMDFQEDTNEAGLEAILKDEKDTTVDEKTTVLIGKLMNAEVLVIDDMEGVVSKKGIDGNLVELRRISNEYNLEQKIKFFAEFLISEDGKLMRQDLEKELKDLQKKEKEAAKGATK